MTNSDSTSTSLNHYQPMTPPQSTQVVADLETASKNDALHLKELETELAEALQSARSFGSQRGSLAAWNADWNRQWDDIGGILRRISAQVDAMAASLDATASGSLPNAIKAWEAVQSEDARLLEALKVVRTQVGELGVEERKEWNIIARMIESHMETTHQCAESLRLKLVTLKEHADQPPEDLSTGAPSNPSIPANVDRAAAEPYDREYRKAAIELEKEHHRFSGLKDIVKGLWMWSETPDERIRENRSLTVDET